MLAGERLSALLATYPEHHRLLLAYSGGLDSRVLLHRLAGDTALLQGRTLQALHINHQLQPRAADWARRCRDQCVGLGVEFRCLTVDASPGAGESPEAAARRARYQALGERVDRHTLLLTAHHRDDQAETVLLALLRGSGPRGLAGMPLARPFSDGILLRPLLDCSRASLLDYARRERLDWIEDPSNADPGFDRNYLRARVLPVLCERWPAAPDSLTRSARHCADAEQLLGQLAALDLERIGQPDRSLDLVLLKPLDRARRGNLLRHWLRSLGLPLPSDRQLRQLLGELPATGEDRQPCWRWPGAELRRYRQALHAMAPLPPPPDPVADWRGRWLQLSDGSCLSLRPTPGAGLAVDGTTSFSVRLRRGGERFHPVGRGHGQSLKKLLQEVGIPPWVRERLPLLYLGDELLAVPGVGVAVLRAVSPDQVGLTLEWQNPHASVTLSSRPDAGRSDARSVQAGSEST